MTVAARRFHLMGGECNYLLRVNPTTYRLEFVPEEAWQTPEMLSWDEDDIKVGCVGPVCLRVYSHCAHLLGKYMYVCACCPHVPSVLLGCSTTGASLLFVWLTGWCCCLPGCLPAWLSVCPQELLDEAQVQLVEGAARLCMPVQLIRKTRSVGVVPTQPTIYEVGACLRGVLGQQGCSRLRLNTALVRQPCISKAGV